MGNRVVEIQEGASPARLSRGVSLAVAALLLGGACGGKTTPHSESGELVADAGTGAPGNGQLGSDAGNNGSDAGNNGSDAGNNGSDAGNNGSDAGSGGSPGTPVDGGIGPGEIDAGLDPISCPNLGQYNLQPEEQRGGPPYTVFFRDGVDGCEALVAAHFHEPETYDVQFRTGGVLLTPREFRAYEQERSVWSSYETHLLGDVLLTRDASGDFVHAALTVDNYVANPDTDCVFPIEFEATVQPLGLDLNLRETPPPRDESTGELKGGFLPWEAINVSVWPPLLNNDGFALTPSTRYQPWQVTELMPVVPSDSNYPKLRQPQIMTRSDYFAPTRRWRHDDVGPRLEATGLQDIGGRSLNPASLQITVDALTAPIASHDFNGDLTFRLYLEKDAVSTLAQPAECVNSGCLTLASTTTADGIAAGVVDTTAASMLKIRFFGAAKIYVFTPDGELLNVSTGSLDPNDDPWQIPLPQTEYVGVAVHAIKTVFSLEPVFLDRIWAE